MSLPAAASTGSAVAALRQAVATALPALHRRAGFGAALPGEYRSAFPPRLRAWRVGIVVLALLWLVLGIAAVSATAGIVRVVGHDAAPSVAAAERIRTDLAAANADFALASLSAEGVDGAFMVDMRRELRGVNAALVAAAGNVTYGDEERGPIATALQGLGDYEQLVGRAVASTGDARRDLAFAADALLHWTVLPAAATLERVNADHLSGDYAAYLGHWLVPWLCFAAVALLLILAAAQVDVARTAHRFINPGLALAMLVVALASAYAVPVLISAGTDLRSAKLDAFDSIYVLSTADAVATDFDAGQTFFLLAEGDAARQARFTEANLSRARRLLDMDKVRAAGVIQLGVGQENGGYIGDELANITFPGEREAALDLVEAWTAVLKADDVMRGAERRGDRAMAFGTKTADVPASARRAFARFDLALAKVRAINEAAFDERIASAEGATRPLVPLLAAAFVLAMGASWFGIGRRLDDYRF